MKKDIVTVIGGFLTSLLLFLGAIGITFEWLTREMVEAFTVLIGATIALLINLYAVWNNTLTSKKISSQKKIVKQHDEE